MQPQGLLTDYKALQAFVDYEFYETLHFINLYETIPLVGFSLAHDIVPKIGKP